MASLTEAIGVLAGLCGIAGFAPQIVKMLRTRNASAVSLKMYLVTTATFALWVTYGVLEGSWPIIAANSVMLAMAATILALKLRYR